jgi:methylated-DNA-[protein]-cysteine S-methyltransferase
MYYDKFTTQLAEQTCAIILVGDEQGISQLMVDNGTKKIIIAGQWTHSSTFFSEAKQQLREFFAGQRQTFELNLNPAGTAFQQSVWQQLRAIPFGELHSYKDIATALGNPKASRAVGMANNKNPIPIIIPCHRVIGADKKLVGYAYGLPLKKQLIELETCQNQVITESETN